MATYDSESDKVNWYNPKNLINGISRAFGGTPEPDDTSLQGEVIWTLIGGYVLGNSIGTANTRNGRRRFNLGPVYIW